jgi:hypothetical protein
MSNSNNKTWAVTIRLTVVATEDPLDDNYFSGHMHQLVLDDYDMSASVEGAILVGSEAVELSARPEPARPYILKTEPVTEPAVDMALLQPYLPPPPMEPSTERSKGKRASRIRGGRPLHGVTLTEYAYFSSDYRNVSKQLSMGVHSTRHGRDCAWLTEYEARMVYDRVMKHRAAREARRAAKGGE